MKNSLVKNRQEINVIIKMERISIQIDSPSYIKISEIGKELLMFSTIINNKYSQINFEFKHCI